MPLLDEAFETIITKKDSLTFYSKIDKTIPSSLTIKSISPSLTTTKLRRYVNKIKKSINNIKNILDETSPGLLYHIKVINQDSLILAKLSNLYYKSFTKIYNYYYYKSSLLSI